jgi:Cft2 family RNA processing exonuclease
VGLTSNFFTKSDTRRIYCTEYTKKLICAKYEGLEDFVNIIHVNEEKTVHVGNTDLHVTPLNANHCAGSVMYVASFNNY